MMTGPRACKDYLSNLRRRPGQRFFLRFDGCRQRVVSVAVRKRTRADRANPDPVSDFDRVNAPARPPLRTLNWAVINAAHPIAATSVAKRMMEEDVRALCWHGKGDVRVDTVPDPVIQHPRDAIIRITASAICGSDLHLLDGYQPTMESGDILGHENMGEVIELGSEVRNLRVGDRVVV